MLMVRPLDVEDSEGQCFGVRELSRMLSPFAIVIVLSVAECETMLQGHYESQIVPIPLSAVYGRGSTFCRFQLYS